MLELAICDDDIILCNWLEQKLLHYGKANDCQISIEIYYSAEQLLNRLEEESYDMLFLDICLEHENGIDIGTEIRKKNYGKELQITYISTYQEYAMKLFRIHPFDFLVKPIREEELFRVWYILWEFYVMGFQSCSFNGMRQQEIRCIITWDRELS